MYIRDDDRVTEKTLSEREEARPFARDLIHPYQSKARVSKEMSWKPGGFNYPAAWCYFLGIRDYRDNPRYLLEEPPPLPFTVCSLPHSRKSFIESPHRRKFTVGVFYFRKAALRHYADVPDIYPEMREGYRGSPGFPRTRTANNAQRAMDLRARSRSNVYSGRFLPPLSESIGSSVTTKPKRRAYLLKRKALTTGFFDNKGKDEKEKGERCPTNCAITSRRTLFRHARRGWGRGGRGGRRRIIERREEQTFARRGVTYLYREGDKK